MIYLRRFRERLLPVLLRGLPDQFREALPVLLRVLLDEFREVLPPVLLRRVPAGLALRLFL